MRFTSALPDLAFVRVLTAGGPYAIDDVLSVAFVSPLVGRLAAHGRSDDVSDRSHVTSPLVPESISAVVVRAAGAFAQGDELTLSFLDPGVARIHPTTARFEQPATAVHAESVTTPATELVEPRSAPVPKPELLLPSGAAELARRTGKAISSRADSHGVADAEPVRENDGEVVAGSSKLEGISLHVQAPDGGPGSRMMRTGVRVRLHWTTERVRRFVRVVDKLYTVDRLGWYRHAFAMRLLVPDDVTTGDELTDIEAMRHLLALRAAAVETLGRPLLAALMPNFSVTQEWLDGLDSPAAARAVAGLRDAISPHADDPRAPEAGELDHGWTIGTIGRQDLAQTPAASLEALLPLLIPCSSPNAELTERLTEYRYALGELFGQTAQCADVVRVNRMSQPNHSLDDRLWQLVGVVGETFGALAGA